MSKYKKLLNTSLIIALGNFGSKFIVFFMLPLYTKYLTQQEYGKTDLIQTTISLLLPVVSLSVFDAVLRFSMDKHTDKNVSFSNGLAISIIGSILVFVIGSIMCIFNIDYLFYLIFILILQIFQSLFTQFAKANNKIKIFSLNGIFLSLLTILFNIVFIAKFRLGISGFLLSLLLANCISNIYLFFSLQLFKYFNIKLITKNEMRNLLQFSIPLIPNSIAWWLTNAVGRYFILFYLGTAANGIYAVSNKIPTLLSVVSSIFTQSWQLSAIEEGESKDKNKFFSKIFDFYFKILFLGTSFILLILKLLISILVASDFYDAWKFVPFLILSVVYSSFSGFFGQNYIVAKKTNGLFVTTIIGAIINVGLNFLLIPKIGLNGVGISSLISYIVIFIIRAYSTREFVSIKINYKLFFFNNILIFCQIYLLNLNNNYTNMSYIIFLVMILLNFWGYNYKQLINRREK